MPPSDADGRDPSASPFPDAPAEIRAAIAAGDGAIGFDRFMDIALYGSHGFYRHHRAGRRGDFLTSAEVGPLFGAVVARYVTAEWQRLGEPDEMWVVDAGAGPGTLARSVLMHLPDPVTARVHYAAVEISEVQRRSHPEGVLSVASLAEWSDRVGATVDCAVVVANELLDNLAFRLAVFDGAWREAFVVDAGDGTFAEVLSAPFEPRPTFLPERAAHGARAPIHDAARRWVETAVSLMRAGSVLAIDYASPTTAMLAARPYREWLRTYRGHEGGDHPLRAPGTQDITSEVAVDQLLDLETVRTQTQWLQRWGIDELVDEGRAYWEEHASAPDLVAMRMRSRISEAEALLDPVGLGSFSVLEWRVG